MAADAGRDNAEAEAIGERLAVLYRDIGRRIMRDLPIYNDALCVDAIGFRLYHGCALGMIVTPWFMNIVSAPSDPLAEGSASIGTIRRYVFPCGAIDFIVGHLDHFGRIDSCSLFSPMFAFSDAEAARATAKTALAALFDPELGEVPDRRAAVAAPIDRRRFLRGELREPRT